MENEKYPIYYAEPLDKGHTNNVIYEKIAQKESPAGKTTVLGRSYGFLEDHKVWKISKSFYYNFLKKMEKGLKLKFNIIVVYGEYKARIVKRRI